MALSAIESVVGRCISMVGLARLNPPNPIQSSITCSSVASQMQSNPRSKREWTDGEIALRLTLL